MHTRCTHTQLPAAVEQALLPMCTMAVTILLTYHVGFARTVEVLTNSGTLDAKSK